MVNTLDVVRWNSTDGVESASCDTTSNFIVTVIVSVTVLGPAKFFLCFAFKVLYSKKEGNLRENDWIFITLNLSLSPHEFDVRKTITGRIVLQIPAV